MCDETAILGRVKLPRPGYAGEDEDRFGHKAYVEELSALVRACPDPYRIGLFGPWGTGKTGILERVQAALDSNEEAASVYFDVWRYSDDSLRRQLLLKMDADVCEGKLNLKERLHTERVLVEPGSARFDWGRLWRLLACWAGFAALVVLLLWQLASAKMWEESTFALVTALGVPFFLALYGGFQAAFKAHTTSKAYPRPTSPDEFEDIFVKEVMEHKRLGGRRLVLLFDNLDRCDDEAILSVLRGISTFLEQKRCVCVVACDDKAIEKCIAHCRGFETGEGKESAGAPDHDTPVPDPGLTEGRTDAREFLKKLFHVALRIPPLTTDDVRGYSEEILRETSLAHHARAQEALHVVRQGVLRSPRRIKQFLSNLAALHSLSVTLEKHGELSAGCISDRVDFLAKVELIRDRWPEAFARFADRPRLLETAHRIATGLALPSGEVDVEEAHELLGRGQTCAGF
jgi:hypothetical protein